MLFRTYVSRNAASRGRAILEGIGLNYETIEACFQNNQCTKEEVVQEGLIEWTAGQGEPPTWEMLIEAMHNANFAQQHIHGLKTKLHLRWRWTHLVWVSLHLSLLSTEYVIIYNYGIVDVGAHNYARLVWLYCNKLLQNLHSETNASYHVFSHVST